jgi:hypothetical protein
VGTRGANKPNQNNLVGSRQSNMSNRNKAQTMHNTRQQSKASQRSQNQMLTVENQKPHSFLEFTSPSNNIGVYKAQKDAQMKLGNKASTSTHQ